MCHVHSIDMNKTKEIIWADIILNNLGSLSEWSRKGDI